MAQVKIVEPLKSGGAGHWLSRVISRFSSTKKPVAAPEGMRIYAIGDIHGRADLLDQLNETILADSKSAKGECVLVYLGDYVDRGSDSKGVIQRLLHPSHRFKTHHLRGNHDQVLLDFLDDPKWFAQWKLFGAQETLMSYGVIPPRLEDETAFKDVRDRLLEKIPSDHLKFLQGLPFSLCLGDYFFVHAGVRPGIALEEQLPDDMLWIREDFLASRHDFGVVVVHGHTPTTREVRRFNRIGIDTGAYATARLTAVVLEGETCRFLHT
jgi:serine/threonine protein phosphatase 1